MNTSRSRSLRHNSGSPGIPHKPVSLRTYIIAAVSFIGAAICFISLTKNQNGSEVRHVTRDRVMRVMHWSKLTTPSRVLRLIEEKGSIGDRLGDIKEGKASVREILHNGNADGTDDLSVLPPMSLTEVTEYLSGFLNRLHEEFVGHKGANYHEIWEIYHDLVVETLYPWDKEYLKRMPKKRMDDSIFLSVASYRDENCLNTISMAYEKAKNPNKLVVGLVQQNCVADCISGVLEGAVMEKVEPDQDCHAEFCSSALGKVHCDEGRVRALHVNEDESLGPYAARYFASKLWYGEQWFVQIDSHMTFAQDWDTETIDMLKNAPSKKPVISHYPPAHDIDFQTEGIKKCGRLCGPAFSTSEIEDQIIRLEGVNHDPVFLTTPRFAPFIAAGYYATDANFLHEVPFDPFLPWIFMGEEIIMSARMWTSGYDIFSPTKSVVGHVWFRRHKPKFWESVHRLFHMGVHNPLSILIVLRIKHQVKYPESARDMIKPKSILTAVDEYSMGKVRPLDDYLEIAGLDMNKKEYLHQNWCAEGKPPKGFEKYAHLYNKDKSDKRT